MIFYMCKTQAGQRLAGTQADAKKLDRSFHQIDVPTDKSGLMEFINYLYLKIGIEGPVRGVDGPFDMDDSGQPITDIPDARPALSQADVDKIFEPSEKIAKLTPDDVDEICMLVEQMRGAAIGHVAHSLAARIERLGKEVRA